MCRNVRLAWIVLAIWFASVAFAPMGSITGIMPEHPPVPLDSSTFPGLLPAQDTPTVTETTVPVATATSTKPPPTQTAQPTPTAFVASLTPTMPLPTQTTQPTSPTPTSAEIPKPRPEEFAVFKVEPERISRESGGTLSIYGSGFGAGIAVRLVGYGLLDATLINPTAIRAVVPPNLKEGRYGVEVIQSSGTSIRLGGAVRIKSSEPKPTDTPEPGPALTYARPALVIQAAETEPDPVRPGATFTLRLHLVNRGDYTATDIRIALAETDLAIPKEGSNIVVLDKLDSDQEQIVELALALGQDVPAGYTSLQFTVEYSDYYRRDYLSEQSVGLQVSDTAAGQPLVLLNSYDTQPASLSPGDAFILHLELANVGGDDASQLLVTLGGQEGEGSGPFAILGSGNIQFIPKLVVGEKIEIELQLILDGSAESGVYNLPVSLDYEGPDRVRRTESQVINLLVSRHPNLRVDYYLTPDVGLVGQQLELPIEVVNIGRNLVNVSTIQVNGTDLQVIAGTTFVGALEGGTSGSLDAQVIPEESGTLPVIVTVNYLDDFNQQQFITQTLTIDVEPVEPTPEGPGDGQDEQPSSFWGRLLRFFRGLIGLGS